MVDRPATVDNIKVTGPGINSKYCRANTPITFKVDATRCTKGNLDVKMTTDKGIKPHFQTEKSVLKVFPLKIYPVEIFPLKKSFKKI